MKHRKIGQQLAGAIAKAIANKAFEHLIPAAKKAVEAVAVEAYSKIDAEIDLYRACEYGLVSEDESIAVSIRTNNEKQSQSLTLVADHKGFRTTGWGEMRLVDNGVYARAKAVHENLDRLCSQKNQLSKELRLQLIGKTTKQALEAWPEAAEIITSVAALDETGDFVKPLETLLAKFLPALPAPAGQGV